MFIIFNTKKRIATISIIALSIMLILSLLPSGFAGTAKFSPLGSVSAYSVNYIASDIALNPGKNETELNLTWYTPVNPIASKVQMAKKSDMIGNNFPVTQAVYYSGASSQAATVSGVVYYSNKVTATNLQPSTQYVYRVGDGDDANWSPTYNFSTQDAYNYSLMFVGDPQIGASGSVTNDTIGWTNTLNKAVAQFPNFSFIMSAGDQVEHNTNEAEYDAFESPSVLRNLPMATAVGNHDTSINYKYHFNVPNESSTLGVTSASGDYYYTYGDSLFMVLNTNNTSGATHVQFMKETVAAVPNMKWKFVTFHHDIYGAGPHSTEGVITGLRTALFPTFDELNIDFIFMGHDHSFVRTFVMKGDIPQKNQLVDSQGRDVNPNGSMYITANSASGSKYYELMTTPEVYSAVRSQLKVPTFSTINVTPSSVTVNTFRTDTMAMVDTYGMVKVPDAKVSTKQNQVIKDNAPTLEYYYSISKASAVNAVDATFSFDHTKIKFVKAELVSPNAGVISNNATVNGDTVRVVAGLTTPLTSKTSTDAIKLTFELPAGNLLDATTAVIQLVSSSTASSKENIDYQSVIGGSTATIPVKTYYSICDLNGDNKVTGADLSKALDYYRASSQDPNWATTKIADVNDDGVVDLIDFTMIQTQMFKNPVQPA